MRTITIKVFEEGEKVYFLKGESKVEIKEFGTKEYQFRCPMKGIVVSNDNNNNTVMIKEGGSCHQISKDLVFASKEEAETKSNEINKNIIATLKGIIDTLKDEKVYI